MKEILLISGMFLVTFLVRYLPFAFAGRLVLPKVAQRILRFVPPAVLSAIVVPAVLFPRGGSMQADWSNPYLVGAMAAAGAGFWKQNLLLTLSIGMGVFFFWQFFWN